MRQLFVAMLLAPATALASPYDAMIDSAAYRHGVDPIVMRTLVAVETQKLPWSFNVDGEGFRFDSASVAIRALWQISHTNWMVKIRPTKGDTIRQLFPNQASARAYFDSYRRSVQGAPGAAVILRTDPEKSVGRGEARIRQLWMLNTDIGIAQINYRFHGRNVANVQKWFDPAFNLDYAASYLAKLKAKHGSDITAAGYYHSKNKKDRDIYMAKFMEAYRKEKSGGYSPIAVR